MSRVEPVFDLSVSADWAPYKVACTPMCGPRGTAREKSWATAHVCFRRREYIDRKNCAQYARHSDTVHEKRERSTLCFLFRWRAGGLPDQMLASLPELTGDCRRRFDVFRGKLRAGVPDGGSWAWRLAALFAVIYFFSASRTVILDNLDAAEFQTVGAAGGLLHQPYPLWCVIARVFSAVPVFEPAFRVTLVSVFFASLCVGLLFLLLFRRTQSTGAAVGGAVAFGLSFTFWQFSAVAEIYSLVTFFFIAALYLIDRLAREDSQGATRLLTFTLGVLLSQQTLNMAAVPGLIILMIVAPHVRRQMFATKGLTLRAVAFVLPFSLYLYTYLVDRSDVPMNWWNQYGRYVAIAQGHDPTSTKGFFEQIWFQMWIGRLHPVVPSLGNYVHTAIYWGRRFCGVEFPFVAPIFIVTGFISLLCRELRNTCFLLALIAPYLALALTRWGEEYAYSFPVYVVAMLFLAEGIVVITRHRFRGGRWTPMAIAILLGVMPVLRYAKSSPVAMFMRSDSARAAYASMNRIFIQLGARNDDGKRYGQEVERLVEPGALVFGRWREVNTLFYRKYVLGGLKTINVSYKLPTADLMAARVERLRPTAVYLTYPPGAPEGDLFVVTGSRRILVDQTLYRVRVNPRYVMTY